MNPPETTRTIPAFGGKATLYGSGAGVDTAMDRAESVIVSIHETLTRFDPDSELCRLNADPRPTVPVSPIMFRFIESVRFAGELSGGLVDASCLEAVERSGYTRSLATAGTVVDHSMPRLEMTAPAAAVADPAGSWADFALDADSGTVTRPPGLRLDAGGLGKGLAADLAAEALSGIDTFAVECLGELRFGGTSGAPRLAQVASPDPTRGPVAHLEVGAAAIATSGTTKRSWIGRDGTPSHHLIDPRTGTPAYSGIVQVTALAPTALEAEVRAKAALIEGPAGAIAWLPDGGVIVRDDLRVTIVPEFTAPETLP